MTSGDAFADELRELDQLGFAGFVELAEIRKKPSAVPAAPGVYCVLRRTRDEPAPRPKRLSPESLLRLWVPDARLLLIAKAPAMTTAGTLREQLTSVARGKTRSGARLQGLLGSGDLCAAWKCTDTPDALQYELQRRFIGRHGCLPFANR